MKNTLKRSIYLFAVTLLSVSWANAQMRMTSNVAVQSWIEFDSNLGQFVHYVHNEDFCDYCLYISYAEGYEGMSRGTRFIISPGKRQIRTYRAKMGDNRRFYHYFLYRGNGKEPDTGFIYALPVTANNAVTARIGGVPGEHQLVFDSLSDTVYACRGGVVCDDNLNINGKSSSPSGGLSQITLFHADGSFGEYIFKGNPLLAAGEKIKMGDPIAVVESDSNKYSVRFSIYFLDRRKLSNHRSDFFSKHTHLHPFFQTANEGKAHLEYDKTYLCEYTDEMLMQDMSRREKKKLESKSKK